MAIGWKTSGWESLLCTEQPTYTNASLLVDLQRRVWPEVAEHGCVRVPPVFALGIGTKERISRGECRGDAAMPVVFSAMMHDLEKPQAGAPFNPHVSHQAIEFDRIIEVAIAGIEDTALRDRGSIGPN